MSSIEDFFNLLNREREKIENEIQEAKRTVEEFLNFITSGQLFKDYSKYYTFLYKVQTIITPLIQRLLSFEMSIRRIEAQAAQDQVQQELQATEESQKREGILSKLSSIVRRRRAQPKPAQPKTREELIEYGRNIIQRLDIVWKEYRHRYYLIKFQDTEASNEREKYSELEFISYLSDVCADIITFVEAAYQMRIQEIEARYESMVKALTVSETQQPLPSR
ncbi:MAG: hypothetical protein QXS29_05975 [Nitrososphaeria archaeon]